MLRSIRKLYDWVLSWADSRYSTGALAALSFCESSFFPVPPDVLLMALAVSKPKRSFFYSLVTSVASVIGGLGGYLIGFFLFEAVGKRIINFYGFTEDYNSLVEAFRKVAFISVFLAALTPIPYKVFTIASGVAAINLHVFVLASVIGRSLRFFFEGALIFFFGKPIRNFIEKYFNLITIVFAVLLVGGFILLRYVFH